MAVSSDEKWSWAGENRDILNQAEAGGIPAVGERYTNNTCGVIDVIVQFVAVCSIMAVIVVKNSKVLSKCFIALEDVYMLEMRERMRHLAAAKNSSH